MNSSSYYSLDSVVVLVAGIEISNYSAEGDSIIIEFMQDNFTETVGNDGNVVINKNLNQTGTFTFNLMQTSKSNAVLSGIWSAAYNGVFSTVPVAITDLDGKSLFASAESWIIKMPSANYGKTANNRQWQLRSSKLQSFIGGSSL